MTPFDKNELDKLLMSSGLFANEAALPVKDILIQLLEVADEVQKMKRDITVMKSFP